MIYKLFPLFFFLSVLLTSCHPEVPKEIQALQTEAIRIHDEVMPKMSSINKTRRKLRKLLKKSPEKSQVILKAIKDLEVADDAMMDWMADYKKYHKLDPKTDASLYYKKEIESIKEVQRLMLTALINGKKELEND